MIAHIWKDGSVGHEFEIGDRVICMRESYSLRNTPMGHVGAKGEVVDLDGYSKDSTYHTTFLWVRHDNGGMSKHLGCDYSPDCEPKCCIIESEVEDDV